MKTFIILSAFFGLLTYFPTSADGEPPQLLLTARRTSIEPHSKVSLDVYAYNAASQPVTIPSLVRLTGGYTLTDTRGNRLARAEAWAETSTAPQGREQLGPKHALHRRINMKIDAEPGDVVIVDVALHGQQELRSNSILLYCPPKR
jgi:hypothetical protein